MKNVSSKKLAIERRPAISFEVRDKHVMGHIRHENSLSEMDDQQTIYIYSITETEETINLVYQEWIEGIVNVLNIVWQRKDNVNILQATRKSPFRVCETARTTT